MPSQIDYKGKKCVVVGGSSGMGDSCTKFLNELGAEIYVLDLKEPPRPCKAFVKVNLGDKAAIDAAVAQLPDGINAIFHCAGIAGRIYAGSRFTDMDVVKINFIGARYFIESMIPKMAENSAITIVSSIAGNAWRSRIKDFMDFVSNVTDWDAAVKYVEERSEDELFIGGPAIKNRPYEFTKECVCIYAAYRSWDLAAKKIRINTISPGATKTPMHDDFREIVGKERGTPMPTSPIGYEAGPDSMASAMLFLNSDMADYISGQDLPVDYGLAVKMFLGANALPH